MKWRGWTIPDRDLKAWLCPVFHPSYVERMEWDPAVSTIYLQDLKRGLKCLDLPLSSAQSAQDEQECIEIIEDQNVLFNRLKEIRKNKRLFAFDLETTGLKPHGARHRIVTCAISTSPDNVFSFMFPEEGTKARKLLCRIMQDEQIKKIAHNMVFEHSWMENKAQCQVRGWYWDSMLAAHVLDNRPGITGLKFQAYVNFGIIEYDSFTGPYLSRVEARNANSLNRIHELLRTSRGKKELLFYNAMDALLTHRLALIQMKKMEEGNENSRSVSRTSLDNS